MALISETRRMLAALEEVKPSQNFLRDRYVTEVETSTTEYVDIDVMVGSRKMAAFVNPLGKSKIDQRVDGTTQSIKPPYLKPGRTINAADLQRRFQGEDPFNPMPLDQKLELLTLKDLADLRDYVNRREEWMIAKQLTTGAMTLSGEGISATITLPMLATHKLANTDLIANGWDQANSNPLKDFSKIRRVIAKDSGLTATEVIFGATAWDLFESHTEVKAALNIWNSMPGQLTPTAPMVGAVYQGRIKGLDLWTYDEWYIDDQTGAEDPMISDKKIVVISPALRAIRKYGAIMDLRSLVAVPFFPKVWEEEDPSVRYVVGQSAPMPIIVQVNGFAFAQVQA